MPSTRDKPALATVFVKMLVCLYVKMIMRLTKKFL